MTLRDLSARYPGLVIDEARLASLHADSDERLAELYLCAACDAGEELALAHFDRLYLAPLTVSDEAKQVVRQKLLVDRKLREFSGKGELARWLKAVAARVTVDLLRAQREDAVDDRVLEALLPPSGQPELAAMHAQARVTLREAVHQAMEALDDRERLFVQHYHLDGLTLQAIGTLYGVAPSTVMRSLEKSRERIRRAAREHLGKIHGLSAASIDSLVRAADSHYEP